MPRSPPASMPPPAASPTMLEFSSLLGNFPTFCKQNMAVKSRIRKSKWHRSPPDQCQQQEQCRRQQCHQPILRVGFAGLDRQTRTRPWAIVSRSEVPAEFEIFTPSRQTYFTAFNLGLGDPAGVGLPGVVGHLGSPSDHEQVSLAELGHENLAVAEAAPDLVQLDVSGQRGELDEQGNPTSGGGRGNGTSRQWLD